MEISWGARSYDVINIQPPPFGRRPPFSAPRHNGALEREKTMSGRSPAGAIFFAALFLIASRFFLHVPQIRCSLQLQTRNRRKLILWTHVTSVTKFHIEQSALHMNSAHMPSNPYHHLNT